MRIGIDAMGGDRAPSVVIGGALAARERLKSGGDRIALVGDEAAILEHLNQSGVSGWQDAIDVYHASEAITMDELPVEALRAKPDSSISVLVEMHARGEIDACISAGNTGAYVAAAQMRLRRLPGVHRPGIAILTPTHYGPVAICDVGANVNCRPRHLQQYGVMASVYLRECYGVTSPRVGLLSVGEEDAKGNYLVKETRELMRDDSAQNFIGNVEGRDLFSGTCDVMICDGFVGNVILKLIEGMAVGVLKGMLGELIKALPNPDIKEKIGKVGKIVMRTYDFNEYGGAPLLGVGGMCLICHGASEDKGIMNAVLGARKLVKHQVNEQIVKLLSKSKRTANA
ncbi:MAG: phosphate acyltransferase PlsX [Planctomycetes bacterium]|nr:phosphate acyltransferase PlsX [Planctomycetota bacterium]